MKLLSVLVFNAVIVTVAVFFLALTARLGYEAALLGWGVLG